MAPKQLHDRPSLWITSTAATRYLRLARSAAADVVVVGGGITGITAAYQLAAAGARVVLLEKDRIAMAESGHTTAHVVEFTDADYGALLEEHGEAAMRANTAAVRAAMAWMRARIAEHGIECGLRELPGYLYAEDAAGRRAIDGQRQALARAGVACARVARAPLPFANRGGLRFDAQLQLHIREYLLPLARAAARSGAVIHERSAARQVERKGGVWRVTTDGGTLRARRLIVATHAPIEDRGLLWAKMQQTRTYVVAARLPRQLEIEEALYWDSDSPYHYTRIAETSEGRFLIVGGEDRPLGDAENDERRFAALERYSRERFGIRRFTHRWSGQINEPVDGLPLIGESSLGEDSWMATGYSGTGITYGTVAGLLVADLALGRDNEWSQVFDPARLKIKAMVSGLKQVLSTPKRMAERLLGTDVEVEKLGQIRSGQGKVAEVGGKKVAVWRSPQGRLHAVAATCTHMGCSVTWNAAEGSWDCPCHGSRFGIDGTVLNGPAVAPLEPVRLAPARRRRR